MKLSGKIKKVRQKISTNFARMTRWNIKTINNYHLTETIWHPYHIVKMTRNNNEQ